MCVVYWFIVNVNYDNYGNEWMLFMGESVDGRMSILCVVMTYYSVTVCLYKSHKILHFYSTEWKPSVSHRLKHWSSIF